MKSESENTLAGCGVAVTRGEGGQGPLSELLATRGARPLDWGTIAFEPPEDLCDLYTALIRLRDFDWICFSSPRAVDAVTLRVPPPPAGVKVAAVGPSTAAALEESGWTVHRIPIEGRGKGLVDAFREAGDAVDARVFFPASALARPEIPEGLEALGASVHQCIAYQMVYLPLDPSACRAALEKGEVDAVTFASPSAMEGLRRALGSNLFDELARSLPAAAIGPTTAAALRDVGWREVVVGKSPTLEALVDAAAQAVRFVGR